MVYRFKNFFFLFPTGHHEIQFNFQINTFESMTDI